MVGRHKKTTTTTHPARIQRETRECVSDSPVSVCERSIALNPCAQAFAAAPRILECLAGCVVVEKQRPDNELKTSRKPKCLPRLVRKSFSGGGHPPSPCACMQASDAPSRFICFLARC